MAGTSKTWAGSSLDDLYHGNGPWNFDAEPVSPSKRHAVMYQLPINLLNAPRPHINSQILRGHDYVTMPFWDADLYPITDENGRETYESHWKRVQLALIKPIKTSRQFQDAVSSYNGRTNYFAALHNLFEEVLEEEEAARFFDFLLPRIIELALRLPDILPASVPLLKQGTAKSVSLSQLQIACLLANAFLCTFSSDRPKTLPGINFDRLFSAFFRPNREQCVIEKLKCICHYFKTILNKEPVGVVTFERKSIDKQQIPRWDHLNSDLSYTKVHICSSGLIEDNGDGFLQVDFANKFVGGGVLAYGCVQEEIRYIICPELIVSRLFTEELGPTEALVVTGIERYSKYSGYSNTFIWEGKYEDHTPYDSSGRRRTTIVAIDATKFNKPADQFHSSSILRELNKAYSGFHSNLDGNSKIISAVATGNWGCGAFKGDPNLKFLIQLMACNANRRDMVYFTFDDNDLRDSLYQAHLFLATNHITVTQLWKYLCALTQSKIKGDQIFAFIQQAHFDNINMKQTFSNNSQLNQNIYKRDSQKVQIPKKDKTKIPQFDESDMSIGEFFEDDFEDIINSSQLVETVSCTQKDKVVKNDPVKKNKIKTQQNDIFDFIDKIDGVSKKNVSGPTGSSLLNLVDSLHKSTRFDEVEEIPDSSQQMEVDEKIEINATSLSLTSRSHGGTDKQTKKKRITDYFTKVDKG